MSTLDSSSLSKPKAIVFGSQSVSFDHDTLHGLQSRLNSKPELSWIRYALAQLPELWNGMAEAIPDLRKIAGAALLQSLPEWSRSGDLPSRLPNTVLTPLVVAAHLADYVELTGSLRKLMDGDLSIQSTEFLGLCTGLLSAAAAAVSQDQAQLEQNGAIALRLAVLIGALVDADDMSEDNEGQWTSLTAAWNKSKSIADVKALLGDDAYISVMFDDGRATITTPRAKTQVLKQALKDEGVTTADFGLRGRFHCQQHSLLFSQAVRFCHLRPAFRFGSGTGNTVLRDDSDGSPIEHNVTNTILRAILLEQASWASSFSILEPATGTSESLLICVGSECRVPTAVQQKIGSRVVRPVDVHRMANTTSPGSASDKAIAVVGMSCQLPGAADMEEFWQLLAAGKSQHTEVPEDRFTFDTHWRDKDSKRKWYGNFIQDHDAFDHKFFKKSPREMSSTDPQHRLVLQAAYQAVEQSGYFSAGKQQDKHIGCYIGVGLVDYENNIACYPANAYSATGNLKSFAAGKISHHFGWTGPGLTIDTACSSSAVAVHTACQAILSGECTSALAGGVNVMSSLEWFQNLAGASFLSPTGQCKPFDAKGDGYCRGEGVGAVLLKKLSSAVADGDQILGVVASSGVQQNENCTPITVPNAPSLSDLFNKVVDKAGLKPLDISYVEAHGTGTPIGDPAEYDSVRRVFGEFKRGERHNLSLGSVKGLLGHTESASGIVALLKALMMVHKGAFPPQASFSVMNPTIGAAPKDKIDIDTTLKQWPNGYRAALINNYGASGSNASLVVTQPPQSSAHEARKLQRPSGNNVKWPVVLSGFDERSIREYASKLLKVLNLDKEQSLAGISFQLCRQANPSLPCTTTFSCSSIEELQSRLTALESGEKSVSIAARPSSSRPVVLCFGGQISTHVGLDRQLYESCTVLRTHLDACNAACKAAGGESIYPPIFSSEPIEDIVTLQTCLFAAQYSCAMSWIDSMSTEIASVVGLSFGELTAVCVSGMLPIDEAMRIIVRRASIIRDSWGPRKGSMAAVEADQSKVEALLQKINNEADETSAAADEEPASIACFNGPTTFTVAGPTPKVEKGVEMTKSDPELSGMKSKKLEVTNAFHSALSDAVLEELEQLGQSVTFSEPQIPFERAVDDDETTCSLDQKFFAEHMRHPACYNQAVHRIAKRYPSAIWLEAGTNSTITSITSRALGSPSEAHFQGINLSNDKAWATLADATLSLWKQGVDVAFWPFHRSQTGDYKATLVPPYQFEKSRHWMELKKPQQKVVEQAPARIVEPAPPNSLATFLGYQDKEERQARFMVNTSFKKFDEYVKNHKVAQASLLCPSTLQLEIVVEALSKLRPDFEDRTYLPQLHGMTSQAPMVPNDARRVWLEAEAKDTARLVWSWKMTSTDKDEQLTADTATAHVDGLIHFRAADDADLQAELDRYSRLTGRDRCRQLLDGNDNDEVIQGRNIYKAFQEMVEYGDMYHGVQKIVGKGLESAGRISKPADNASWLDTGLTDVFCQIAGIFVNCMTDRADSDMYISDRIDQLIRSPSLLKGDAPQAWEVTACHYRPSDKEYVSDVFVFDALSGALVEAILGIHYSKVGRRGLGKLLQRLGPDGDKKSQPSPQNEVEDSPTIPQEKSEPAPKAAPTEKKTAPKPARKKKEKKSPINDKLIAQVKDIIADLSGLDLDQIKDDSEMADLGIDSLMGMELAREIESAFNCTLPTDDLIDVTNFPLLLKCIEKNLSSDGEGTGAADEDDEDAEEEVEVEEVPSPDSVSTSGAGISQIDSGVKHEQHDSTYESGTSSPSADEEGAKLPSEAVIEAFQDSKQATDDYIAKSGLGGYSDHVMPRSNELVAVHILDAFEQLGCDVRRAHSGDGLSRIQGYLPRHEQFVDWLYGFLENVARLIDVDGSQMVRTSIAAPAKSAQELVDELVEKHHETAYDHKLTYMTGVKLADCLTGKADALQLLFGTPEGREVTSGMYGKSPINLAWVDQMEDLLQKMLAKLPAGSGPIKILEMGAGTGGTTAMLLPMLDKLDVEVHYTVTDLSSSLVAGARKRFKGYKNMQFRVFDIEKAPAEDLLGSQHIILATNCVHATHSLVKSTTNIRKVLRPDGVLMMLEMTLPLPWVDLIFGLIEGWWLFDDGRKHALSPPEVWQRTLQSVGYGHVDWTEGSRPEAAIQRVIIALASETRYERESLSISPSTENQLLTDVAARRKAIDDLVRKYTESFQMSKKRDIPSKRATPNKEVVLVTGATGSLGCHLLEYFASLSDVEALICLNRKSPSANPRLRQQQALESKGIQLSAESWSKVVVFETDTSKPKLGLSDRQYEDLIQTVTHIVHNAWPMSITRPLAGFEGQFKVMRNLIQLLNKASAIGSFSQRLGFQLISSIAVTGHYPLRTGDARVPEEKMDVEHVLPCGYGDAKLICERMLDETLHQDSERFRAMTVRIGQIAGSQRNGFWNPTEHFAFLIKSSQTLRCLPDFDGHLSWLPVNDVAATLGELLRSEEASHSVYQIENPIRQSWKDMTKRLASALGIQKRNIVPFDEWVTRARQFPGSLEDNPAGKLIDFLDENFIRMSCGGLILDTKKSIEHSLALRKTTEINDALLQKYVASWKEMGFLHG